MRALERAFARRPSLLPTIVVNPRVKRAVKRAFDDPAVRIEPRATKEVMEHD